MKLFVTGFTFSTVASNQWLTATLSWACTPTSSKSSHLPSNKLWAFIREPFPLGSNTQPCTLYCIPFHFSAAPAHPISLVWHHTTGTVSQLWDVNTAHQQVPLFVPGSQMKKLNNMSFNIICQTELQQLPPVIKCNIFVQPFPLGYFFAHLTLTLRIPLFFSVISLFI